MGMIKELGAFGELGAIACDMAEARWTSKRPISYAEPQYLLQYGRFVARPGKEGHRVSKGIKTADALANLLKTATPEEAERIKGLKFAEEELACRIHRTYGTQSDLEKKATNFVVLGMVRRNIKKYANS